MPSSALRNHLVIFSLLVTTKITIILEWNGTSHLSSGSPESILALLPCCFCLCHFSFTHFTVPLFNCHWGNRSPIKAGWTLGLNVKSESDWAYLWEGAWVEMASDQLGSIWTNSLELPSRGKRADVYETNCMPNATPGSLPVSSHWMSPGGRPY